MTEQELEQALRRALQPVDPSEDFSDRTMARLEAAAASTAPVAGLTIKSRAFARWGSVALAACTIAGIGLAHLRHETLERQRGLEARAQLLQALSIASASINTVRVSVIREEEPMR